MATFPSLSKAPLVPIDEDIVDDRIETETEAGYVLTRNRGLYAKHRWSIKYGLLSTTDTSSLLTFYLTTTVRGALSFTWPHPVTSTSYTVRFSKGSFKSSLPLGSADKRRFEFTLEEV